MCICSLDDSEKPCYKEAMRCSDRLSNTILYKSKMDKKCFLSQYAIPIAGELMHMVQNSYREREMQREAILVGLCIITHTLSQETHNKVTFNIALKHKESSFSSML